MKKLVVLAVLILALSASMAGATSWTTLVGPGSLAVQLGVDVTNLGSTYQYDFQLWNKAPVGYTDLLDTIDIFSVTFSGSMVFSAESTNMVGWSAYTDTGSPLVTQFKSNKPNGGVGIASGAIGKFSFTAPYAPNGTADAYAADSVSFNGITMGPDINKPVPEASTLVGFGSALVMAGPGMVGWLRRRRA